LRVSHSEDADETGNFEVFVGGVLAHSKTSGDGYVDTPAKLKALKRAVRDATVVETVGLADGGVPTAQVVADERGGEGNLLGGGDNDDNDEEEEEEESNASIIVSMLTLVLSIPALIGA